MTIEHIGIEGADSVDTVGNVETDQVTAAQWDLSGQLHAHHDGDMILVGENGGTFGEDTADASEDPLLRGVRRDIDEALARYREDAEVVLAELHRDTVASVRDFREQVGIDGLDDFGYPIDGPDDYDSPDNTVYMPSLADIEQQMRRSQIVDAEVVGD